MKITDYSIIFVVAAICFIAAISVKSKVMYEKMYISNRYNVVMDNAVEDALRVAYENIDNKGKPIVNLDTAYDFFINEVSVMFDGDKKLNKYYEDRIELMIYTTDMGYYYCDNINGWSDINYYGHKESTSHSEKIRELTKFMEYEYGILIAVPYNEGESYQNSIGDYSLMAVYKDYGEVCCFSAAMLSENLRN